MIVWIELQLSKCTNLVQCDVKIWFVDIFEEHEYIYMFCTLIQYMIEPRHVHLIMKKNMMRYLKVHLYGSLVWDPV